MNRMLFAAVLVPLIASVAPAQFGGGATKHRPSFNEAVPNIKATIEPSEAARGQTVTWRLTIQLIPGWHTYPTVQPEAAAKTYVNRITPLKAGDSLTEKGPPEEIILAFVGSPIEPANPLKKPEPIDDIKELRTYEGTATWEYKAVVVPDVTPGVKTIKVPVRISVCDEQGCLAPKKLVVETQLTVTGATPAPIDPQYVEAVKAATTLPSRLPTKDQTSQPMTAPLANDAYPVALGGLQIPNFGSSTESQSNPPMNPGFGAFLLTAAAWGLISLVTPCVFPMIPITVSYFLKQSEKQHINPLLQALVYCGTIVVVLGIAALTLLGVFRELSVNPWTNVLLGALFIVLALSLFGMFELTLPNSLTRWTSSREGRGGLAGTVFMALTFTIVSFTCVAPFLGGFAGIVASGQFHYWEMALGALAFSSAFAAPFFLLALFPSALRRLPRSGGWLNSVKVVMGFLELAAALKFFRTAELRWLPEPAYFTYDVILCLWVALALVCGLYLLNLFRLGHDEVLESVGVPRMLWGMAFLGLAFYMLPGIFRGGPEGTRQRPSGVVFAWIDAFLLPDTNEAWAIDLPKAVSEARAERKLLFVDFTGLTCTNCRYNEQNVFSRPEVRDLFKKYKLVQMYTDEVPARLYSTRTDNPQREIEAQANLMFQRQKFGTEQLPLYVILDPQANGKVAVVGVYDEGKINQIDKFVEFLKRPLAADTARAAK